MQDPHEISVDEESKLTLHGLLQYYVKLTEKEKNEQSLNTPHGSSVTDNTT